MFSIEVVQEIHLQSIAVVRNGRTEILDDDWGAVVSEIVLSDEFPEDALQGIEEFSHLEVIFFFDRAGEDRIVRQARHPRGNSDWPKVGIFAQRGKNWADSCEAVGTSGPCAESDRSGRNRRHAGSGHKAGDAGIPAPRRCPAAGVGS